MRVFLWYIILMCGMHHYGLSDHTIALLPREFDQKVYNKIGSLIWRNECGLSKEKLTWWNEGEEFASLGIGHFIWYPADEKRVFTQVFPDLLRYFYNHSVAMPSWLSEPSLFNACPWKNREQFFEFFESDKMQQLRALLSATIDLQAQFIIMRTQTILNTLIMQEDIHSKEHLCAMIHALQKTPNGLYTLIDYINFKGIGTSLNERYNGQGWGLVHVLSAMPCTVTQNNAVRHFVGAAKKLLELRVKNSPAERNEKKFLAGWANRVDSYMQPLLID